MFRFTVERLWIPRVTPLFLVPSSYCIYIILLEEVSVIYIICFRGVYTARLSYCTFHRRLSCMNICLREPIIQHTIHFTRVSYNLLQPHWPPYNLLQHTLTIVELVTSAPTTLNMLNHITTHFNTLFYRSMRYYWCM